jgi:membrane fusion protein, multidrug efflux system
MFLKPAHSKQILTLTLLTLSIILSSCSDSEKNKTKRSLPVQLVETALATQQDIAVSRTLSGTLQALREIRITNQTQGILTELAVYPGDKVEIGSTLAHLDNALTTAEVQKAEATLKQAVLDLRRLKNLAPRKLASESEIASAKTQKDIAAAELLLKQTELSYTHIKSPINGFVSERLVESGDVLASYSQILSLIDTSSLKAEIYLSELLLPLINKNNPVSIKIDALGNRLFTGKIKRIYPTIDKTTRRGTIEIVMSPVPEGARPGQLCRVTIQTQKTSRLMIPYDAIRHDKYGTFVFALVNGQAKRMTVRTGIQQGNQIEVLEGITDQQRIITKGFFGLKNKMKVQDTNTAATQTKLQPSNNQK